MTPPDLIFGYQDIRSFMTPSYVCSPSTNKKSTDPSLKKRAAVVESSLINP
eukprot:CAMPEP_0173202726 /NCGR_PEP_ID=MMETSP1141-20130122/19129_1 /TAXON_ID=483371 /ORGANISM="non described non described, Strain CCMP2298" /LENGTH=50 /DNA_ID=CAMNT_0014128115 /DNA_START=328 /DNA_END=480 /DNA_ORIENTATION=-